MKRSELRVGAELYYAEPANWNGNYPADGICSGYRLGKAIVLATEPHSYDSWLPRGQEIRPCKGGNGVLVDFNGKRRVVQLGNLRGPYESTLIEVKERYAIDQERTARQRAERQQHAAAINAVVDRLVKAGAASAHQAGHQSGSIVVRAEELTALLDTIDDLRNEIGKVLDQ